MQNVNFDQLVDQAVMHDPRFARDAYQFMKEALDFTQKHLARENLATKGARTRHVSGKELLEGIRLYALKEYGPMTVTVLAEWGVNQCQDFGEIVFNMVEQGVLKKTDKDNREDYRRGYDFTDAFRKPFWPENKHPKPESSGPEASPASEIRNQ